MFRGSRYSHRQRPQNTGLLLLAFQLFRVGLDNVPPVTLALLGAQVFFFAYPIYAPHDYRFPPLRQVCLSAHAIVQHGEYLRLIMSAFFHGDDMHLYYNMTSLVWKGRQLEPLMGAKSYSIAIVFFVIMSGMVYVASVFALESVYGYGAPLTVPDCAVGFSGVLFAMKVILSVYSPGQQMNIMGFRVSDKYAYWVELVLIHFIAPNSSFLGHLCGIAAGLIYIQALSMRNPLNGLFNSLQIHSRTMRPGEGYRADNNNNRANQRQRLSPAAVAAQPCIIPGCSYTANDTSDLNQHINAEHFNDDDHIDNSQTQIKGSIESSSHPGDDPTTVNSSVGIEELRRARLARFEKRN